MFLSAISRPKILAAFTALSALLVLSPASAGFASSSYSAGKQWVSLRGSMPQGLAQARRLQPLASDRQIEVGVALRVRDQAALDQLLSNLYDPSSPSYHHFLTPQQFADQFGADDATRSSVADWLKSQGLQVTGTSSNGLEISAQGTVSKIQAAFGTPVYNFQKGSRTFFANTQPVRLPATVASDVLAVSGLSTSVQQAPAVQPHVQQQAAPDGYSPSDLRQLYNLTPLQARGITGAGQTIGIVSFADYSASTISTYEQQFNLSGSVSRVSVSDGRTSGAPLGASNGEDEAEMDIELTQAAAPRANILVYEAPNSERGSLALFNRIVSDNRASVVTSSWGAEESTYSTSALNAIHQAVQEGAAQGQSFFSASGDAGAYDAAGSPDGDPTQLSVDYPASDPWVTGVGGTTVVANGSQYVREIAWSDRSDPRNPAGSGGGLSTLFSRPSWQTGPGVDNQYSNGKRQVPDVAADADPQTGYAVYTVTSRRGSQWGVVGGTSASAPVWAGFTAVVNQALGRRIGFLNPTLYQLGQRASTLPRAPFHDITQGDNLYYPATSGWDFATGWGSFDGDAFVSDVQTLPAPAATPTSVPTAVPTATTAASNVTISKVLLLHTVNGKQQATSTLKVGESGRLVILYTKKNSGSLKPGGTVAIRQNGKVVQTLTLKATTYQGKPALTATVHFTSTKRVGQLKAQVTVTLGSITRSLGYTFKVAAP